MLLLTMLPWLNQCILYIKRRLRDWRTQKCNPFFGAESPLRCTGLQSTSFHAAQYSSDSSDFPKFRASINHGTVIAPMHFCIKRRLREWRTRKCNPCFNAKSPLRCTGLHNTWFHAAPYRADSSDFPKFGAPSTMVPWLLQCVFNIKRKLRE